MAITQKGPTYPSMFNPLSLISILIIEALFFGEGLSVGRYVRTYHSLLHSTQSVPSNDGHIKYKTAHGLNTKGVIIIIMHGYLIIHVLHNCSLIGMVLIIAGLYSFLWGKHNDTKEAAPSASPPIKEIGDGRDLEETIESGGLQSSATVVPTASSPNLTTS